ncbi:MAG: nucleoside triphosphate pyrophosphohydrolase ham1 [Cirrosporium novae-zelandiae]|nr:MAG: nucleoside triphosphate pyrophosphohydrolase ham1 [Cirrosporium novae-zelandiae]
MATTAPPKPTTLTFVTGNANKLAEVRVILANTSVQLRNQEVDLIEVQGATLEEISVAKCLQAIGKVDGPVLTEDTALCFRFV